MCFDFCHMTLEVINFIAPWLSQKIGTGASEIVSDIPFAASIRMRLSQRLSRVAFEVAIYSASRVERATTLWDFAC